jgi:hypothetical protein
MEVVADHNSAFKAQGDALGPSGHRLDVPGLRDAWLVQLRRRAKVNKVKSVLPALNAAAQRDLTPSPTRSASTPQLTRRRGRTCWTLSCIPAGFGARRTRRGRREPG